MKKRLICLLAFLCLLMLTSCNVGVRFGEYRVYVPWYVVWVPTAVIMIIAYIHIIKGVYVCSNCGNKFSPKWYELYALLHLGSKHFMRCPKCKHKDFFGKSYTEGE